MLPAADLFFNRRGGQTDIKKGPEDGLEKLGFTANDNRSNRISLTTKLDSLSTISKMI